MESTDTSTSTAGVGLTPAAAAAAAPTLSRKELLDQYRRNKAAGNTSEGLQSKIQSLKASSVASGTKRPVAARTPVTKTSIDRAKVQQAGERAVAPGTPVHALQKRLKLTSSSNAGSTGRPAGAVPKSSSSLFGSTAATDVKKQPLSKAQTSDRVKVHRTALAPATTNTIAVECGPSAMTAGSVKPVGSRAIVPPAKAVLVKAKELVAWVEEANQLVKLGFMRAARALLEGLGPDPRTTGKALYWLVRAKIEEEQGDWERASDLLEEGRSHITEKSGASSLDAVMMKEAIAEFKTRRTAAAVKEVDGLLDDSPQRQRSDHPSAVRAVLPPPPPSAVDFHDTRAPAPTPLAHDGSMSAAESPPGAVKGFDSGEGEARLDYGRIGKALETHMSTLGLKSPAAKALRRMAESGATSSIKDDAKDTDSNGDSAAASEGGGSTADATHDTHRVFRAGHVSKLRQMFEKGALTGAVALPGMAQLNKADRNSTSTDSSSSSPPLLSCANLSKRLEDAQLDSSDGRGPRRESDGDAVLSRYLFDDSGDDDATVGASSDEEEDNVVSAARTKNCADGAAAHARVGRVLDRGGGAMSAPTSRIYALPKTATTPPVAASASLPMALSSPGLLSGGGARRIAVESKSLGNEAPHKLSEERSREDSAPISAVTGTSSFTARTGGASGATKPPAGNTRTRAAVSFSESPVQAPSSAFLMPPPPAKPLSCASTTATTKTTGTFIHTSSPTTTRTGRARAAKRAPTPFKPPAATPTTPTDPHADNTDVHTGTPDSDHTTSGNRAVQGDGGGGVRGDGCGVAGGVRVGGGSALVGAYEQDGESGKRRATPMPSKRKTTNNKQVATDAAGGTYMTEVTMKTKDGALTTTPVRRSSRLTQTPTPTPIRRNIERMLVTPVDSSMDNGGVEVPEIPGKAGRGAGWWLDS